MRFAEQNEPEREEHDATGTQRDERAGDDAEREGDLKNEIRRVTRSERREPRPRRGNERVVVHPGERLFDEVREVRDDRDRDQFLHGSESTTPRMKSTTARSICSTPGSSVGMWLAPSRTTMRFGAARRSKKRRLSAMSVMRSTPG